MIPGFQSTIPGFQGVIPVFFNLCEKRGEFECSKVPVLILIFLANSTLVGNVNVSGWHFFLVNKNPL